MKRPNSADNFNNQKLMKFIGPQANAQQAASSVSDVGSNSQSPSYANQNPMTTNYMANNAYYLSLFPSDLANSMYSQLGLNAWQMSQSPNQSVFDTSRPPPPPLPTTPAPEDPPPPPLPPHERGGSMTPPTTSPSTFRSRGGYGHSNYGNHRRGYGKFRGGFNRGAIPSSPSSTSSSISSHPSQSGLIVKSPASLNGQVSTPTMENARQIRSMGQSGGNEGDSKQKNCPIVHKKKRRKPMSERLPTLEWKRADAQRVLELEKEYHAKRGDKAIIVRFPDPKLDYEVVKGFSSSIESVHFQQPAAPRSCIVHLKKGADVKKIVEELNKTPFGQGFLSAEPKRDEIEDEELAVEDIDPYTLYIGNLPSDVNVDEVKAMFHTAKKVDVGYAQRMKVTRYGFARYTNVDDAIEAYKTNFNALYKSRSIIVRFRRNNRSIGLDGDRKWRKKEDQKQVDVIKEKNTIEEISTTSRGNAVYGNESEDGEDETEDTKSGVFEYASNLMENWLSDDLFESGDDEENLPNLTGMIKHEPDDDTGTECLRTEDDEQEPKDNQNTTPSHKSLDKATGTDNIVTQQRTSDNEKSSHKNQKNSIQFPNGTFKESNFWEEIRQRELSEKEEKPDIQNLQPSSSKQPDSSNPPITTYGLVPFILPKEEEKDPEDEGDATNKRDHGPDDYNNTFNDEDNIDAAFENAWNELAARGT